ncbi:type II secretion system F family protein [Mycolicibacterium thermoresistibile]
MTWAAILLATALLIGADVHRVRARAGYPVTRRHAHPTQFGGDEDPLAAASTFDVFAACLRSGMAVAAAATATAPSAPPLLARLLERAAGLLALGADPATAWSGTSLPSNSSADALMRLARRSATSGAALADGVAETATEIRHQAEHTASAAAERAGVLIAGPLGLCYLPAFICLGIVPVIAGLAGDVLQSGLL